MLKITLQNSIPFKDLLNIAYIVQYISIDCIHEYILRSYFKNNLPNVMTYDFINITENEKNFLRSK